MQIYCGHFIKTKFKMASSFFGKPVIAPSGKLITV